MERNGKKRGDECGRKLEEKRRKNNCHSSKRNQKKNRKFSTEQRKVCLCVCVCVCVCVCGKSKCEATGLREYLICNNILNSVCGKVDCKIGKCPYVILPASKLTSCKSTKRKLALNYDTYDESEENEDEYNDRDSD